MHSSCAYWLFFPTPTWVAKQGVRKRKSDLIRIQRKDKMYRVVWWIKPHIVLATNPRMPMMVKIFFKLHEHQLGHSRAVGGEDDAGKVI